MRIVRFVALFAALSLATAACGGDDGGAVTPPPEDAADATVMGTTANVWDPADVTIAAGDTIEWEWEGFHNVAFEDQDPRSGEPTDGGTFSHTFTEAGTFDYVCEVHESVGMVGTVTVT